MLAKAGESAVRVGSQPTRGWAASNPPQPEPNVLLITVDTLRADRLGAYGFQLATSPGIDRLAAQGVVFERAISGASFTAGSHASIMTSRYTREHTIGYDNNGGYPAGGRHHTRRDLQREGYQTAAFVGNIVLQPQQWTGSRLRDIRRRVTRMLS